MKARLRIATGLSALASGLLLALGFALLRRYFGYPGIIREEPAVILAKLHEQRCIVPLIYYFFLGGGGLMVFFFAQLASRLFSSQGDELWSSLGRACGMVSGVLLFAGVIRYTILFTFLAAQRAQGRASSESIDLLFAAFNLYLGNSLAEHSQFLFTSFLLLFFGLSIFRTLVVDRWLGWLGLLTAGLLLYGSLELFGLPGAFVTNRIGSTMAAVWLCVMGGALLLKRGPQEQS